MNRSHWIDHVACTSEKCGLRVQESCPLPAGASIFGICRPSSTSLGTTHAYSLAEARGHPWGNAPGAVANRVALEACVLARNCGNDLSRDGANIIREATQFSPELAAAADVWQSIEFNYKAVDTI